MSESVHTNTSLWSKGMKAVIVAQFLSAFGDNALLFATLALLKAQFYPEWSQPILQMVFVGAYILFAPFVGQVADSFAKGRKVAPGVQALVVPGSGPVKAQAEAEGLDKIFIEAGFEWRLPGCSMCLAMNNDRLNPGERCASTSNRNFEGRQGRGGRTHLVSPAMAAAAAVTGHFADIRNIK